MSPETPSLPELQQLFSRALKYLPVELDRYIATSAFTPEQLVQVYRNNFVISCSEALAATYPACLKMVGEDFFNAVARQLVLTQPPVQGNIQTYGEGFSHLLATMPQLSEMPWLADLAMLEWKIEQTAGLPLAVRPFPFEQLAAVDENDFSQLVFRLNPGICLLSSDYQLKALYQLAIDDTELNSDIALPDHLILVKQSDFTVQLLQTENNVVEFLQACADGTCLGEMPFDPAEPLQTALASGWVTDFEIKE